VISDTAGILDEAYQRLHRTGPEFDGWLSNHGPMAAEAMARHGHGDDVGPWLDGYIRQLEDFPAPAGPGGADETFARAVAHGDEHVIKFADTAADVHARTGNAAALAAAVHAANLIPREA
jgi:hypothetical protein